MTFSFQSRGYSKNFFLEATGKLVNTQMLANSQPLKSLKKIKEKLRTLSHSQRNFPAKRFRQQAAG
ncbi:hypothetical protein [Xanthomonas campestris]|uniref:hypothetical protein n=1 Tax=Xanthomonas campestris TaxID=339 RepID=UPI002AD50BA9|nr:hypothetical protein [Xanthomonas campestris]MEA0928040.1 hypothetical protein [Xanthomonas campestris pv. campestris]